MASPFRIFRKHMKALLVVFGVALMLVFVLGDPLSQYVRSIGAGGGQGPARDPRAVAVRWDGGQLTNAELDELVLRRRVLNAFLRQIIDEGLRREQFQAAQAGVAERPLRVRSLVGPELPEQGVERSVVRVRIFAEAAAAAGMSVDDETIGRYLDELGRRHVPRETMRGLISRLQMGRGGASIPYVFAALREELVADYYMASYSFAMVSVMPQQRWQDWLRVNDRVVIEAAAFPADEFLARVPEPTPTELSEYYDLYKESEPRPHMVDNTELPSPTPGFKIPRKVDVQYVRADFNQLLEKIKAEFTAEEIQKFYDDNKDPYFIKPDTSLIDEKAEETTEEGSAGEQATQESGDAKEEGGAERSESGEVGGQTAAAGESGAAGEEQPTTQSSGEDRQTPSGEDGAATPAEDDRSISSRTSGPDVFRLAAFAQEESGTAGGDDDDTDAAASAFTGAVQADAADENQPIVSAEQPAGDAAQTGGGTETPDGEAGQAVADQPAAEAKPIEFQPLDEVRDKIRELLATPKVNQRLDELVIQLQGELMAAYNTYFKDKFDALELGLPVPPLPPALADLSGLAEKRDVQYCKTGPMSLRELLDDEVIGALVDIEQSTQNFNVRLLATLFDKDTDLYKPIVTIDIDNNRYLVMKASDEPARVPLLDEIRDDVARAWRLNKASELAKKHADDLAKQADAAGMPLSEFFAVDLATGDEQPAVEVVRTDPFAWLTGGEIALIGGQIQQRPFRLSEPDGIAAAGPEFMRTVFELDEGPAAAVLNHDHSIAYVVRLVEHQYSVDQLREDFLGEASFWPGRRPMDSFHAQQAAAAVVTAALERAQIDWVRDPDPIDREE